MNELQKDNFNPEASEQFAKFLGEFVSPAVESSYRFGIKFRETNPFLSNVFMLSGIFLTGKIVSDKFKI